MLAAQFSSLEPDLVCRLLFIRDVNFINGTFDRGELQASTGQTELPPCPVCLERLDEHISGIVITVGHFCLFNINPERVVLARLTQALELHAGTFVM